jgi:FkbM family methyltransferase
MAAAHSRLIKNCISDGNWIAAERMAIGNMDGTIEINVAGNSLSSSVLPMLDSHLRAAPESAYVAKEQVPIRKLDSVARDFDLSGNVFVKIDVQGFEMDVLKGAADTLGKVRGLEIELSLVPLYEGQTLMLDMVHHLRGIGFELNGIFPVFKDEISGRLLQVDGVFFRE